MPRLKSILHLNNASHLLVVALFLLTLFYLLFAWRTLPSYAAPAIPAAPGVIIGTVTDPNGQPLAAVAVSAYQYRVNSSPNWVSLRTATTDAVGTYRLSLLPAGLYRLEFVDTNERYITRFYPNAATVEAAADIAVAGNVVTGIDLQLPLGGVITGTITTLGPPLSGLINVSAFRRQADGWRFFKAKQYGAGTTTYQIGPLPTDIYHICVHAGVNLPPYDRSECYDDVRSGEQNAVDIAVVAGQTVSNINFRLGDRGDLAQLRGLVTNNQGEPLANIEVTAAITPYFDLGTTYYTKTNALGLYHFAEMLPATYTLQLIDRSGAYATTYFGGAATAADAATIYLAQRVSRTIDLQLVPGAVITGLLTVAGEVPNLVYPLPYLQTSRGWEPLYLFNQSTVGSHYRVAGLAAGNYRLGLGASLGNFEAYFTGFYGGTTLEAATTLVVGVGEVKPNVNLDLPGLTLDGQISGRVTTAGAPLANIQVYLYNGMYPGAEYPPFWYQLDGAPGRAALPLARGAGLRHGAEEPTFPAPIVYTMTNGAGEYRLEGIPDGGYIIRFVDLNQRYADSDFNSAGLYRYAETLYVKNGAIYHFDGSTMATVDGELVLGGTIKGQVRLANGQGVAGATINAVAIAQGMATTLFYVITTDANGFYELKSIYPTQYRISVYKPELGYSWGEYYGAPDDASSNEQKATLVKVTAEETTSEIDVVLGPDPKLYLPVIVKK